MPPFKTLSTLAGTLLLVSCASPRPSASPTAIPATDVRSEACAVFAPIIYSRKSDTAETITQVQAHNDAWDALCARPAR